jgi:ATP-dependent Clp protease protease subunit
MEDTKSKSSEGKGSQIKIQDTFLEQRKVFLWGEVSDKSARDVTEKLLYLEFKEPGKPITFYIIPLAVQSQQAWQYMILCN